MSETADTRLSLACTECPYIFTEAEIAAEDKKAWGHPCHEPGGSCESFRQPVVQVDARAPSFSHYIGAELQEAPIDYEDDPPHDMSTCADLYCAICANGEV